MNGRLKGERTDTFARIGFIKCGEKVINQNGKQIPRSLNYFKAEGKYAGYFNQAYPDKPTTIKIIFPSDNLTEICNERYEMWDGSQKCGWGDGENFNLWNEEKKCFEAFNVPRGDLDDFLKNTENKINQKNRNYPVKWSVILTLRFMIPEIGKILGVWEFSTRGEKSSIKQIISPFDNVQRWGGTVTRTFFDLNLDWHVSKKKGNKSAYPVISLVPNMSKQNLEKQRLLLEQNNNDLPLIITENVLHKVNPNQIECATKSVKIDNDKIIDAETTRDSLTKIKNMWDSCNNFQDVNRVYSEIKKMDISDEDKRESEIYRNLIVEKLRGAK